MEYTEVERERLAKIEALRARGVDPYPARARFAKERIAAAQAIGLVKEYAAQHPEDGLHNSGDGVVRVIFGRVISKRVMGKASFVHVEDETAKIQLYARIGEDSISKESFDTFRDLDLGDWIEARGPLFLTKTGEPSLRVQDWGLLSKAISQLPIAKEEKQPDGTTQRFSAFSDPELRVRQRYVDLAVNPEVRDVFRTRAKVINAIRNFLDGKNFLEVETPILQPLYGGAAARPFITHHNQLDQDLYLRISFELYLKRLIAGGYERVYEIGRDFRNEGVSFKHNPEFTMLEFYAAFLDMYDVMDLTEQMIQFVARAVLPPEAEGKSHFRGHDIDWLKPFARIKLRDAVLEKTGIDYNAYPDFDSLSKVVLERKLLPPDAVRGKPWGKVVDGLIGDYVEKNLSQPTFLYDYPRDISPFAKSKPDDPNTVERFEGFVGGAEICNAFSELNDPMDQYNRFVAEKANADEGEDNPVDEDYVRALMYGMPNTGGFGMGIDRLVMMFTNKDSIREVLLFPHLKKIE
ncbi:MAG: lysine--tRNA ligase [Anaerolineae bacterium]